MEVNWHTIQANISDLKPSAYNPRRISKTEFENLKKSISKFGHAYPIVCNKNMTVIGGHQTIRALSELGIQEVSVSIPDRELTLQEEKMLNLALNRIHGEWDENILPNLLKELQNIDLSYAGFDEAEVRLNIHNLMDSVEENVFYNTLQEMSDFFSITFVFPKEKTEIINNYIKAKGKDNIRDYIIKLCENDRR